MAAVLHSPQPTAHAAPLQDVARHVYGSWPLALAVSNQAVDLRTVYPHSKYLAFNVYTHHPLDGRQMSPARPPHSVISPSGRHMA
jgi:DICT domain-containing protein